MKIFKSALLGLACLGASIAINAHATDASITTESTPGRMLVLDGGGGLKYSFHHPARTDFPQDSGLSRKRVTTIEWQTTWYPDAIEQSAELCYFRPYSSGPVGCIDVPFNSSGSTTRFNGQRFDAGAKVQLVYRANSATGILPRHVVPAGNDRVVFHFSY